MSLTSACNVAREPVARPVVRRSGLRFPRCWRSDGRGETGPEDGSPRLERRDRISLRWRRCQTKTTRPSPRYRRTLDHLRAAVNCARNPSVAGSDSTPSSPSAAAKPITPGRRRSATGAEQSRRIAWGKQAGAKVAAAYKQLQEGA